MGAGGDGGAARVPVAAEQATIVTSDDDAAVPVGRGGAGGVDPVADVVDPVDTTVDRQAGACTGESAGTKIPAGATE